MLYDSIKAECDKRNWSINKLESKADLPQGTIKQWRKSMPNLANIKRVADTLCVSVDWLIKDCEITRKEKRNGFDS